MPKRATPRPRKYDPAKYPQQARKLCMLGAINTELADFFGVSKSGIELWMRTRPEFAAAVREGRETADAKVAHALYRRRPADVGNDRRRSAQQLVSGHPQW